MRNAAREIELRAAGHGERLEGTVRVTSNVAVATHHLPAMVAQIRREEPRICIELDVSHDSSRLHFREADIAIRMYRPRQLELVTQHLGDLRLGVLAARTYAERRGLSESDAELIDTPRVRHVWARLANGLRKLVSQEPHYPAPRRG